MSDLIALVAAHDVGDGVDLADMTKELIAQTLALAGALDEPGDVDEADLRRYDSL